MYTRKSEEEIADLITKYSNESLYRAYCGVERFDGLELSTAELWLEAKYLAQLFYQQPYPLAVIKDYHALYRTRYIGLFTHLDSYTEQLKQSKSVCERVFYLVALMYYHEMSCSEEMNHSLTFNEPLKSLSMSYSISYKMYYEFATIKNFFAAVSFVHWDLNDYEQEDAFLSQYEEKKEQIGLVYDYSYAKGQYVNATDNEGEYSGSVEGPSISLPREWVTEEASEWLERLEQAELIEKIDRYHYRWKKTEALYGYCAKALSSVLNLKKGERIDWKKFNAIFVNEDTFKRNASKSLSERKTKNQNKPLGNDLIDNILADLG